MRKLQATAVALTLLLIASNAWWLYRSIDTGLSLTYLSISAETTERVAAQLEAVLRESLSPNATKASIIDAATRDVAQQEVYEKFGYLWVGDIGLKFDGQGKLLDVTPSEDRAQAQASQ